MQIQTIDLSKSRLYTKDKIALGLLKNVTIKIAKQHFDNEVWGERNYSVTTYIRIYYKGGLIYETTI